MPHPESEHGLRVQLATALKERDEALAQETYWHNRATEARDELAAARRDLSDTDTLFFGTLAGLVTTIPDDPEWFDDWVRGRVHAARQQFDKLRKARAALAAPAAAAGEEETHGT